MARRNKPTDPMDARQRAEERAKRLAEKERLVAMGATFTLDAAGRVISAHRSNVFNVLLKANHITPNHHDAAHTLAKAWAAWKGLDGKPEVFGEFVDGGSGAAELVTDRMIRAGKEVKATLAQIADPDAKLLTAFMVATVEEDRPMVWRGIVERVSGDTDKDTQLARVVFALESLRAVYQEPRRAAA